MKRFSFLILSMGLLIALLSGGCMLWEGVQRTQRSSSVVSFLYPKETNPLPPTGIPVLNLPLRVGIAFVPSGDERRYGSEDLSEMKKGALLQKVADEFKAYPFVQSIEIIPATYLRPAGGFANLDQVHSLLGVDVIALVAYDQVQFVDENLLALSYWTIVGAYIFKGNKNDTQTLMEAAVYDIPSRHLLFRAPGLSQVNGGSTMVNIDQKLRGDSAASFDGATQQLIVNLKAQLEAFRERVKQAPETVKIVNKPGYTGGGALGGGFAALLGLLGLASWWRRNRLA